MKYRSININIPQPCHESWDRMAATMSGAFCHSCQTEVIDFSRMTDREMIEYLSKNNVNCGRYRSDQVNRKLTIPEVKNGFLKWRAVLLSVLSLAAFKNTSAKLSPPGQTDQSYRQQKKEVNQTRIPQPDTITVHGVVLDESGKGTGDAVIELLDNTGNATNIRSESDSTGHFSMMLTGLANANYPIQLKVSHWSYVQKTISLTNQPIQNVTVRLDEQIKMIMGKKAP